MIRDDLSRVREWAQQKLATGEEPPWAFYQYMKLVEAVDAILAGQDATRPVGSPQSAQHSETHLRLAVDNDPQETARRRSGELPVQMPM